MPPSWSWSCHDGAALSSAVTVAFVPSTDLDRSRRFYEGVLGLPVLHADTLAVVVDAHGVPLRITHVGGGLSVQPLTVLGWEVTDRDGNTLSLARLEPGKSLRRQIVSMA